MLSHPIRAVLMATAVATSTVSAGLSAHAASFDGPWSVLVITKSGPCDQSYRYGLMIRGASVSYLGGGAVSVSGRVTPSGQVQVSVSAGCQVPMARAGFRRAAAAAPGKARGSAALARASGARV